MWSFLDKLNFNVLYEYADVLAGNKKHLSFGSKDVAERRCYYYYLVNFVYRYILDCDTLEKAISITDCDLLDKYYLREVLHSGDIYIGDDNCRLPLYQPSDMLIILEILYNRLETEEQFECFYQKSKGLRKKRCEEMACIYKEMKEAEY